MNHLASSQRSPITNRNPAMKRIQIDLGRQPDTRRSHTGLRTALVGLSLCFAAAFAPAFGDGRKQDPPPMFFAGDETIGTLPILVGQDTIALRRDLSITQPSLCLEGELADILGSIVLVRGQAIAQVERADARTSRVRVIFPGNVQLGFDRLMIESSSVRVGIWNPTGVRGGELQAVWNRRPLTLGVGTAFVDLPVLALSSAGALSIAPFALQGQGPLSSLHLLAAADQDFLTLRQSH